MGVCAAVPNASAHDVIEVNHGRLQSSKPTLRGGEYSMHLNRVLGEGSFGKVIRARNKKSDKRFAVKCVSKELGEEQIGDAKREASLLKGLSHTGIINVVDDYETPTQYQIVMELCSGGDLYDRLLAATRFTERECTKLSLQIMDAVAYLHRQGVCHRDVKLENFAFSRAGPIDKSKLKLLDFGLAIELSALAKESPAGCGTPDYAAPEVLRGERYGLLVDEWSCGCVIYALLSGRLPFGGVSDVDIVRSVLAGNYSFSSKHWQGVSESAKTFVRSLLQMEASDRLKARASLSHAWLAGALRQVWLESMQ